MSGEEEDERKGEEKLEKRDLIISCSFMKCVELVNVQTPPHPYSCML